MSLWSVLPLIYLAVVTIPLAWIDLREHRLPNVLVVPGYGVLGISLAAIWITEGVVPLIPSVSAVLYLLFLLILNFTGGMGMGDVKLGGLLGGAAGLISVNVAILSPMLAFVVGGLYSLVLILVGRSRRATRIPFGPFMLLGFLAATAISAS